MAVSGEEPLCDRLSFSLGSPKSGVGHGIAVPRRVSPSFLTLFWTLKGGVEICDKSRMIQ
jgi:hypothetical protein